jgi:3'-phosphoadenosine 5'-phosphosulfate (PAPS) 3'-phosphatase
MAETGKAILSTDQNSRQKPNQQKHWTAKEGRDEASTKTDQGHLQGKKTKHVDSTHRLQSSLTKKLECTHRTTKQQITTKKKKNKKKNKQTSKQQKRTLYLLGTSRFLSPFSRSA